MTDKYGFTDTSLAAPMEKAQRVLSHLASPTDTVYFFGDGFPRPELAQDAAAGHSVLNEVAAELAALREEDARLKRLEQWARNLPTPVCEDGVLPLAAELNELDEILSTLSTPVAERESVPEGYKLVPVEPTLDMYYAACKAYCAWEVQCAEEDRAGKEFSQPSFTHSDVYRAMIAAAPKEPK